MKSSPKIKTCRIFSVSYTPFETDEDTYESIDFHVVASDFYEALKKAELYFEAHYGEKQSLKAKGIKGKRGVKTRKEALFSLTKIELTKTGVII